MNVQGSASGPDESWTDGELLVTYRDCGDGAAMQILYGRHQGVLLIRLRTVLRDANLIEDAFQNTWHSVMVKCATYDPTCGSGFAPWLCRIGYHEAINLLRRRREISISSLTEVDVMERQLSDELEALDAAIRRESFIHLWQAIKSLSDDDQQLVTIYYVDDVDAAQIAELFNIHTNTVHTRLHRIRRRLSCILADLDKETSSVSQHRTAQSAPCH